MDNLIGKTSNFIKSKGTEIIINNLEFKHLFDINKKDTTMDSNEEIISKLKFIGKVRQGEKINIRNMAVQQEGLLTKISRSFISVDNRMNTLEFIKTTMSRSFQLVYTFIASGSVSSKKMASNIITDIESSKTGIKNIQGTYSSDIMMSCKLDAILEDIDAKLMELREKHPEQFNDNTLDSKASS